MISVCSAKKALTKYYGPSRLLNRTERLVPARPLIWRLTLNQTRLNARANNPRGGGNVVGERRRKLSTSTCRYQQRNCENWVQTSAVGYATMAILLPGTMSWRSYILGRGLANNLKWRDSRAWFRTTSVIRYNFSPLSLVAVVNLRNPRLYGLPPWLPILRLLLLQHRPHGQR